MNDSETFFIGLIITGIAAGVLTSAAWGWLVIGIGFMEQCGYPVPEFLKR